jgi:predicted membrane channel-forming protein YqfA (hemolysin III family)
MRFHVTRQGGFAFLSGAAFVGVIATAIAAARDPMGWVAFLVFVVTGWLVLTVVAFAEAQS